MRASTRLFIAAASAPMATACLALAPQLMGTGHLNLAVWNADRAIILLAASGYVISLIVGIPGYFILRRMNVHSLKAYSFASFICGVASVLLIFLLLWAWSFIKAGVDTLNSVAVLLFYGFGTLVAGSISVGLLYIPVGILFWLIARPDRNGSDRKVT